MEANRDTRTENKLVRQFLDINYPNATINGDKILFVKSRRKRSIEITELIYELNIIGFDTTYKKLKSMLQVD